MIRIILLFSSFIAAQAALAQSGGLEPRRTLSTLIAAFQNCGPAIAYQMLGLQAFQIVFQQTGGTGCYPAVRQLGPVQQIEIVNTTQYPVGPFYTLRVTHQSGDKSYWQLGLGTATNKVEHISVFNYEPPAPPIVDEKGKSAGHAGKEASEGCLMYKVMCE